MDQGLKSPARRCHSQRSAVRCRLRSNQPLPPSGRWFWPQRSWLEGKAHDHKESVEDLNRTNYEAANASEQAQHHRNDADQPEFPDQAFKPTFNPSRRHGPIRSSVRSLINRISGLGCDTFQDSIKVLSATSANSQDSKNGGFYLPRSRRLSRHPSFFKNHRLDGFSCSPRPVQRWPVTIKTV